MSQTKHERRDLGVIQTEYIAATQALKEAKKRLECTRIDTHYDASDKVWEAFHEAKRNRDAAKETVDRLAQECKEATDDDDPQAKRARLEPLYEEFKAKLDELQRRSILADFWLEEAQKDEACKKKVYDEAAEKTIKCKDEVFDIQLQIVKLEDDYRLINKAYSTSGCYEYKADGKCPSCGEEFNENDLSCVKGCVFHVGDHLLDVWFKGQHLKLHKGKKTDACDFSLL